MKVPIVMSNGGIKMTFSEPIQCYEGDRLSIHIHDGYAEIEVFDSLPIAKCTDCESTMYEGEEAIWDGEQWFCSEECFEHWYNVHKIEWRRVGKDGKPMSAEEDQHEDSSLLP